MRLLSEASFRKAKPTMDLKIDDDGFRCKCSRSCDVIRSVVTSREKTTVLEISAFLIGGDIRKYTSLNIFNIQLRRLHWMPASYANKLSKEEREWRAPFGIWLALLFPRELRENAPIHSSLCLLMCEKDQNRAPTNPWLAK